jgi:hypothetical protein
VTALYVLHCAGAVSTPPDGVERADGWRSDVQRRCAVEMARPRENIKHAVGPFATTIDSWLDARYEDCDHWPFGNEDLYCCLEDVIVTRK